MQALTDVVASGTFDGIRRQEVMNGQLNVFIRRIVFRRVGNHSGGILHHESTRKIGKRLLLCDRFLAESSADVYEHGRLRVESVSKAGFNGVELRQLGEALGPNAHQDSKATERRGVFRIRHERFHVSLSFCAVCILNSCICGVFGVVITSCSEVAGQTSSNLGQDVLTILSISTSFL